MSGTSTTKVPALLQRQESLAGAVSDSEVDHVENVLCIFKKQRLMICRATLKD